MQEVWNAAIAELRSKTPGSFDRWFSSVQFDGLTDGVLQLRAQNAFVRDWVTDHFVGMLRESLRDRTGWAIEVAWSIDPLLDAPVAARPSTPPPPPQVPVVAASNVVQFAAPPSTFARSSAEATSAARTADELNPKYTFANFVVGPSNELAHAAAMAAVGAGSVRRANPLFICGGTGLGKTHLLHAVGHHLLGMRPNAKIIVISGEAFTNEFISAIQNKEMDSFRQRYRTACDLLLVDDIHNLAGKEQTQEEFFHTFNTLHGADKQIVLTSDRYPHSLERMTERLVTRFQWGLVADVQVPQLETRVAIVRKKAKLEQVDLDDEVAVLLAQAIRTNVRELEGALIRLAAQASILGRRVDIEFARSVLASTLPTRATPLSVEDVVRAVCHHFNLRTADILGKDRSRSIAHARHVAIYLCRQRLKCSYPELGKHFGHRDHTTALSAVKKVGALREVDADLRGQLDAIERKLGS